MTSELVVTISQGLDAGAVKQLEVLARWGREVHGAYAKNTERAWRADWRIFSRYCREHNLSALPAEKGTVASFIRACAKQGKRASTIRRYVATITRAHLAAECVNPCKSESVRLAMRAMTKERGTRQKQAAPLLWEHIERILQVEPETLRDYRDRAMLVVAYDTMCRREELVALNLGHISHQRDGSATVLIARAKNDRDGKGHQSYLAHLSVDILDDWIQRAGIKDGALFRVIGGKYDGKRLKPAAVATVFRRCVKWIASSEKELEGISGHSTRVGATQDQLAANIDTNSVKQSGRWADERMVGRYGEHILAARSGMARLAKLQGRTKAATPARKRTSESHAAVAFARSRRA